MLIVCALRVAVVERRGSLFAVGCWCVVPFCVVRRLLWFAVLVRCLLLCATCCWLLFVAVVRYVLSVVSWLSLLSHVYVVRLLVILCCVSYVGAGVCVCFGLFCCIAGGGCPFVAVRRVCCLLRVLCLSLRVGCCCVSLLRSVVVR